VAAVSELLKVLHDTFGYRAFRPGQEEVIQAVLAGRDCIGVMPTGAGKSLTFQLPAKMLGGTVLVISPLISLMKDQVDGLLLNGFRATVINSSVEFEERKKRLGQLRRGELELVYMAPEALEGSLRDILRDCPIKLLVVDEAHCISHWGHEFRPAYRKLQGLKEELGVPVLALTATATRAVAGDIIKQLGMVKPEGYKGSFYRQNLVITCQKKGGDRNLRADMLAVVRKNKGESGIIYCISRKAAEQTAEWLRSRRVRALPYHAGLSDEERRKNQEAFARDQADVIVATVAFGMGIDKSNVRYVVHRDMPKSLESYYQEIGRAGRDGLPSDCVLFYSWADVMSYEMFLSGQDAKMAAETKRKTVEMFRWADRRACRHRGVTAHFEEVMEDCGSSCDVCRGETLDDLVRGVVIEKEPKGKKAKALAAAPPFDASAPVAVPADAGDGSLYSRLKALRRALADAQGVPAYIVFSDAVLQRMAERRPRTPEEMLEISGVGPAKLARYGQDFLEALKTS
jgi:ATP-dependent DNA helicase RecQ